MKYILPLVATLATATPLANASDSPARAFTVADAIEMTTIGHPEYWHHNQSAGRVANYSPDGTKMVMVLRRGNLTDGTTEYSLLFYSSKDLMRVPAPEPKTLLSMATPSNREIFASLTWLPDNRTVIFLGERSGEERQVFSFDTVSQTLKQLTHSKTSVLRYSASADGTRLAYVAEDPQEPIWNAQTRRHGLVVSDQSLTELMVGRHMPVTNTGGTIYLQSTDGSEPRPLALEQEFDGSFAPVLSPDGAHALVRVFADSIPQTWQGYTESIMASFLPKQPASNWENASICEFLIVDVKTGAARRLLDAPQITTHAGVDAFWASDSASILMTFVYLPLQGVSPQERRHRAATPFTAQIELSGAIWPLQPFSVYDMTKIERWDHRTNIATLIRESSQGAQRSFFKKRSDGWSSITPPRNFSHPNLSLREGMNVAPHIVVSDSNGRREHTLLDLNPHFKDLKFAHQEQIEWQASDGTRVRGGLYYPTDFVRGKRYPLVIQTHGFSPKLFAADGIFVTAFAAQALANKDIMVLQTWDFPEKDNAALQAEFVATKVGKVQMHQFEQSVYEGAIDHLDAAGFIDRDKVGVIGFSYTCWSVKYALSHPNPRYHYAAAAVSDGFDGGYWSYIAHGNKPVLEQQFEGSAEGQPWGAGLQAWMKHAPGFNIDKVTTPLRMIPLGNPTSMLDDWEWFVLLKRMGRPVELALVEDGSHSLVKPWDRRVASGGNVDWFDFWLNGRKDPAPEKAEQYARWEKMRQTQQPSGRSDR